jgi:uroporphyrinogen-III synthase
MKVKTILISQPEPKVEHSPYSVLEDKQKVKVDFRPFIHVEGASSKEVRQQKINISDYSAIILTSRNAVDHFFRIAEKIRYQVPDSLKYFCQSEAVAYYLQKYIVYRKRKVYVGKRTIKDMVLLFKKHKKEKFLLPTSNTLKPAIQKELNKAPIKWQRVELYKTVVSDLSDLEEVTYDVVVFFSPSGIKSLFENFPDFEQNQTRIAAFGNSTVKAAKKQGLKVDIKAPTPETPSMTMALEEYIKKQNKAKK